MNAREFFYLVAQMRDAQNAYFRTKGPERDQIFRAARKYENAVDREIKRVREILGE